MIGAEIRTRETLYGEFIRACSKLVVDSFERALDKPETLLPAYELLNRIRLCASDAVLAQAEQVLQRITEQYFSPNLSAEELRALIRSGGANADPLSSFGEACRMRIKALSNVFIISGRLQEIGHARDEFVPLNDEQIRTIYLRCLRKKIPESTARNWLL